MMTWKKNLILEVIIALLVVTAVAAWYMRREPEPLPDTTAGDGGLGAQIFEGAQNPLKNDVPETNPFAADTNPFKAETNPYKDE